MILESPYDSLGTDRPVEGAALTALTGKAGALLGG